MKVIVLLLFIFIFFKNSCILNKKDSMFIFKKLSGKYLFVEILDRSYNILLEK